MDRGQTGFKGSIQEAIAIYTQQTLNTVTTVDLLERPDRTGNQSLRFKDVTLHDVEGHQLTQAITGQDLFLRFHYISENVLEQASVNVAFNVYNSQGLLLTNLNTRDTNKMLMPIGRRGYFECSWPHFNLRAGLYICNLFCEVNNIIEDWIQSAFQLNVEDGDFFNTGSLIDRTQGDILISYNWKTTICKPVSL